MTTRLHDIQYHGIVFAPDANGGPGTPKCELDTDMLNVVWQQGLNVAGQLVFTMSRFNAKLALFDYMRDHVKLYRECAHGTKVIFSGKLIKPQEGTKDAVVRCWDYQAFLQRSRTGFKTLYPNQNIKQIIDAEWNLAKTVGTSPFAFVATGTTETPVGLDGVTPIVVNSQFGVVDFDRLFLFYALSEMSMSNTDNSVIFEITRETPHTFNFWKNRTTPRTLASFVYPGNVVEYDLNPGYDELQNDIATIIVDPTTGVQSEYSLADDTNIGIYRRLQSTVSIKTLYGLNSGTTETDQQKAALARILSTSVVTPKVITVFPRQHELDPFLGWDLGDTFPVTVMKADRSGDRLNAAMALVGLGGSWTPDSGELLQAYLR